MQTLLVDKMFQNCYGVKRGLTGLRDSHASFNNFKVLLFNTSISLRECPLLCDTRDGSLYFSLSKWLLLY